MNRVCMLNKEAKYRILLRLLRPLRRAVDALDNWLFRIEQRANVVCRDVTRTFLREK